MPSNWNYELELIDSKKPNFFRELEFRAMMLADEIEDKSPTKAKYGGENWDFYQQVLKMASWGILQHIDGWKRQSKEYPNSTFPRDEARRESLNILGYEGIQEAWTIAVNGALHAWMKTGNPGFQRGHGILLEAVALNPDSLFYDSITPDFKKELVNMALWEEFPRNVPNIGGNQLAQKAIRCF
jgi:hypothetical protein